MDQLSYYRTTQEDKESILGGVGGASAIRRFRGTTAVDIMANARILEVASMSTYSAR